MNEVKKFALDIALRACAKADFHGGSIPIEFLIENAKKIEDYMYDKKEVVKEAKNTPYTDEMLEDLVKCVDDPVHFIAQYCNRGLHPDIGAFIMDWPRQHWIEQMRDQRRLVIQGDRQVGVTTALCAFALYEAMFKPDQTILILGDRFSSALEMMDKIRVMYENVPGHLRCKTTEYNKSSIVFDNGSHIIARVASSGSVRGMTINTIIIDNAQYIPWGKAGEFLSNIMPCLMTFGKMIVGSTTDVEGPNTGLVKQLEERGGGFVFLDRVRKLNG